MAKKSYSAEFKAQLVLEVLREAQTLSEIAAKHEVHPNQLRNWKREFLEKAGSVFEGSKQAREAGRREREQEDEKESMLKTIGQLTLERDFLQRCMVKAKERGLLP